MLRSSQLPADFRYRTKVTFKRWDDLAREYGGVNLAGHISGVDFACGMRPLCGRTFVAIYIHNSIMEIAGLMGWRFTTDMCVSSLVQENFV